MTPPISHSTRAPRGWRVLLVVVLVMGTLVTEAWGQTSEPKAELPSLSVHWHLVVDGEPQAWPLEKDYSVDSLRVAARKALARLQQEGHYLAEVDSAVVDTVHTPPTVRLYATRGPEVTVGQVHLAGVTALDSLDLLQQMETRPGHPLDPQQLEADLDFILSRYEEAGYPLVQARIDEIALMPGTLPQLRIDIEMNEGRVLRLNRVELVGAERTRANYVARLAGLRPGQSLAGYDPAEIQRRLEATEHFSQVDLPELRVQHDSLAVVRIPLEEEPPGTFDLALGILPSSGGEGGPTFVGNGHLILRNLFGGGREMALQLNRLPGQVSSVDVHVADPYLLGWPLSAEGRFEGRQQDSTYNKQRYRAELGYRFVEGLHAFGTVTREVTRPGQGGIRLVGGAQRVPQAEALFAGLGVRYRQVDRSINPRRGLYVETNFERGEKERVARTVTAEQDTVQETTQLSQERLEASGRAFIPVLLRQVFVLGGEASALLSDAFDQSDLFRFGGATSLRGYDEERFLGNFVARLLTEYRYQLDRTSYAFVFFDLGYVETPELVDQPATRGFHPGYGIGIQMGTNVGLINFSFASNTEDGPTSIRAHFGLSLGL